jgi:hypothetical protein
VPRTVVPPERLLALLLDTPELLAPVDDPMPVRCLACDRVLWCTPIVLVATGDGTERWLPLCRRCRRRLWNTTLH